MAKTAKRGNGRPTENGPKSSGRPPAPPADSPTPETQPGTSQPPGFFWAFSRPVRHARALCRHVRKLLHNQRDILSAQALEEIESSLRSVNTTIAEKAGVTALNKQLEALDKIANKWFKAYPNATIRENVEVLLVALAVAMAVRTFFLQPFKIPTGSMQPTLFGVTADDLKSDPGYKIPTGWERVKEWFQGVSYIHITAEEDGEVDEIAPPIRFLIFNIYQKIVFAGKTYSIWFPPDYGADQLESRAHVHVGQSFRKGEDIVKLRARAGDHLFVDRLTYNFRPPKRGEIVVFETKGIPERRRQEQHPPIPVDQFYIKRLVGLGGETISLQKDYDLFGAGESVGHLVVNGRPITAMTRHFENLYSYPGARAGTNGLWFQENEYVGHSMMQSLRPGREVHIPPGDYFVMGDNTMHSSDSRYWGTFPSSSVIGRACFVYWPFSDRFGWGQQ